MNKPIEWDEAALQGLIRDGVTESLTLDYKAATALTPKTEAVKSEIGKDVSAFANSAGGVIVYGLTEANHLPISVEGVDPGDVTREWLDQVIGSRIQRRIDAVRINQVALAGGLVAYVVVIPQSDRAPHMASDKRFYKRFEFRSVPMEEYEVRDVARRVGGPRLHVIVELGSEVLSFVEGDSLSAPLQLRAAIINDSTFPADHAVFHLLTDRRLDGVPSGFKARVEVLCKLPGLPALPSHLWQRNWGVPGNMPIWNGINFNLCDSAFEVRVPSGAAQYVLAWSVKAPNMATASDTLMLEVGDDGRLQLRATGVALHV